MFLNRRGKNQKKRLKKFIDQKKFIDHEKSIDHNIKANSSKLNQKKIVTN